MQEAKATILYVDDEPDNLTAFNAVFRRSYHILVANSGAEAIQLLEQNEVQVIISDQRMPKMTGVEFFEKIKDQHPEAMRIVLTGYSDMQAIIDAINKGRIYHYVSKPWQATELSMIIDRALEAYHLRTRNMELERQNVQAQFEVLKNQINPHFLFNTMNTLAALIPEKPDLAVKYAKDFSRLFRALLQLKDQLVITLEEELEFVEQYFALQKLRFDSSLHLSVDIPDTKRIDTLPPFALQVLVENAIKHNIVAEDLPLKIEIGAEGGHLVVQNNYQPRGSVEDSTGTGISNLKARYAMLGLKNGTEAGKVSGKYVVKIPLIPAG